MALVQTRRSISMKKETHASLKAYSAETGKSMSQIVTGWIDAFIDEGAEDCWVSVGLPLYARMLARKKATWQPLSNMVETAVNSFLDDAEATNRTEAALGSAPHRGEG